MREARRLFAERGAGVALESVAEAAGVGIATLYRNFASREELLDAVAIAVLDDVIGATNLMETSWEQVGGSTWDRWLAWADALAELELGALSAALAGEYGARVSPAVLARQDELSVLLNSLFSKAREEGLVGGEVTALEFIVLVGRLTRPQALTSGSMAPDLGSRAVRLMLEGLRCASRVETGA